MQKLFCQIIAFFSHFELFQIFSHVQLKHLVHDVTHGLQLKSFYLVHNYQMKTSPKKKYLSSLY